MSWPQEPVVQWTGRQPSKEDGESSMVGQGRDTPNTRPAPTLYASPSGHLVLIRPCLPSDAPRLHQFYLTLSESTRRLRYNGHGPADLEQREPQRLISSDPCTSAILLAIAVSGPRRAVVGIGELVADPENPRTAHIALVVADHWQGQGIGSALAARLGRSARAMGFSHAIADVASENTPVRRLLQKSGLTWKAEAAHGEVRFLGELRKS